MPVLRKIIRIGDAIQIALGVACLAVIVLTITAGIISRYVFNMPFDWTEELATFLFIWLSFVGAGVVSSRRKHVVVDFLTCRLPQALGTSIRLVSCGLIILFLTLTAIGSVILFPQMTSHASVALGIPKYLYYMPIMLVSFYMIVVYLVEFIELLDEKKAVACKERGAASKESLSGEGDLS